MKDQLVLLAHVLTTPAKLLGAGGVRAIVADIVIRHTQLHASVIPLANARDHHLMLVVDTGISIAMTGLTVTETSHFRVTSHDSCGNLIMLALKIARIRDSRKVVTGL
jgi:hypothetical protein